MKLHQSTRILNSPNLSTLTGTIPGAVQLEGSAPQYLNSIFGKIRFWYQIEAGNTSYVSATKS